jgi:UDP-4-amino-4,6-dideoxy-N-acetyl-beta-L-altrosamine N-acetyltransferase
MQISNFGIILKSITQADLEMIRIWRNSEYVRPFMSYDQEITPAMQQKWFGSLELSKDLYFIISINNISIGVINLKDINHHQNTAEAGIFIGDTGFMNTIIPVLATLTLMEFAFQVLKLSSLRAKIKTDNEKVIRFNNSIGYELEKEQNSKKFHYYSTSKELFENATRALRAMLEKVSDSGLIMEMSQEERHALGYFPST